MQKPTLVVASGPPGAGKTTLAHRLAHRIGCPAICRDEIKNIRVVHCHVTAKTALARIRRRRKENPARRARADSYFSNREIHPVEHEKFDRVQLDAPELEVDTSDDYRPGLYEIVAFANAGR